MKLISMVDFVFEQQKNHLSLRDFNITNYANFLKQPLELWMFVPCKLVDGVWVVLEELKGYAEYLKISTISKILICEGLSELKEYQQAKERCLFEGFDKVFEDDFKTVYFYNELHICFGSKNIYLGKQKYNRIYNKEILTTIEDLVKYNLELTPTAQKQIGLWTMTTIN